MATSIICAICRVPLTEPKVRKGKFYCTKCLPPPSGPFVAKFLRNCSDCDQPIKTIEEEMPAHRWVDGRAICYSCFHTKYQADVTNLGLFD
jgi:formylmethanofuran dehydrogenase subunit E